MRNTVRSTLFIVLVACALGSGATLAQTTTLCPTGKVCVDYHGHTLEIDPKDGPVQDLIVRKTGVTVEDLDSTSTTQTVTIAEFVQVQNKLAYELVWERDFPRTNVLSTADAGDTFGLHELAVS